jgi:putative ABC transport system substrate-binding protein
VRRREFITLIGGAAAAWPLAARGQQKERVRRIGILMPFPNSDIAFQDRVRVFRQELARLGWSEGTNVQFDERWSTDNMDVVRVDAATLVNLNPDVIVIVGDRVIPVFMALTRSIPIVVGITSDPIAAGAAESLARPGRNVTGFSLMEFSVFGKMLEILKRMAPGISRVGMIYNPDNPVGATYWRWFEPSAGQVAVQPINLPIHDLADIERAIAGMAEEPKGGILSPPDLTAFKYRTQVVTLAARHRAPAIYTSPAFGGLVSYGADTLAMMRGAAAYVDRILRGEKAGELPFQQPTSYRLVLNLKIARTLGLTVPPSLLVTADEVIE